MLTRSRKLPLRGVSASREIRVAVVKASTASPAAARRASQRAGQMKLLSAKIIIGRSHQIYRKKSVRSIIADAPGKFIGFGITMKSALAPRSTQYSVHCTRSTRYQAHRVHVRATKREKEREKERVRVHPFPERCSGAFHACMEIIKIKWPITNDCCKEGSPFGWRPFWFT